MGSARSTARIITRGNQWRPLLRSLTIRTLNTAKVAIAVLSVYSCCIVSFLYLFFDPSARRHWTLHPRSTQAEGSVRFRTNEWLSTRSVERQVYKCGKTSVVAQK